ncbi:DMT family transporter [Xenorhabdus hominickii]|uniref:Multidrug DMT transporter permease n=1 Tax=Xenorhabdus hominickii TaxID=351679 RepID=A0A2G0Q3G2_XENHO|nr:DMT family transporter [Xenorhabdus hominickii]AOM39973.1 multidrug DMT transporter permease [Xenorhabdus hominickii]PHM52010.1 multidrug DMT transporter permease [Xenorhabdus hominickii]PHM52970.1 multidrug DMT transporter permease [Xenorhabdus hominickii]PHM53764.1 multidrug DMT transporter permease [Xenorhabdus hominickii]
MTSKTLWNTYGSTSLFVLLWSSGAVFSRWGLDHSSSFAILTVRFAIAFLFLLLLCLFRKRYFPMQGTTKKVAGVGLLIIAGYSIFYFLALENGITPGILATVMGIQPIITLWVMERHFSFRRLMGLLLSLTGLILVVFQGLVMTQFSFAGTFFSLAALACMSIGAIFQKQIQQPPSDVLPLQYGVSLLVCLLFVPFKPFHIEPVIGFIIPVLWLGLVISVVAQLLLYRLIRTGNLVNVTSLFYLVPAVTAIMDYLFLGNALSILSMIGMVAIILGLVLIFREKGTKNR